MRRFIRRCWLALATVSIGCRSPATQVHVYVETNAPITRVSAVRLRAARNGASIAELRAAPEVLASNALVAGGLPGSFTVLPPARGPRDSVVTMLIQLELAATADSPAALLERVSSVRMIPGAAQDARVFLSLNCAARAVDCATVADEQCTVSQRCIELGATCGDDGECVEIELPTTPTTDGGPAPDASARADASVRRPDAATDARVDSGSDATSEAGAGVAVRLLVPLSGHIVTTATPTVRFSIDGVATSVSVDHCTNRLMTENCTSQTLALGARSASLAPLERGWWFWRVRATIGGSVVPSHVWQMLVSSVPAAPSVDTSHPAPLDFDGDGHGDVAIGIPSTETGAATGVRVYFGPFRAGASAPSVLVSRAMIERFGETVAHAGDVDGDGRSDLVVGSRVNVMQPVGRPGATMSIVYGAARAAVPQVETLSMTSAPDEFAIAIAGAGDVNGDGFSDVLAGATQAGVTDGSGYALLTLGGSGRSLTRSIRLSEAPARSAFGQSVAGLGDVNGDGYGDFAVGAPYFSLDAIPNRGRVYVFLGDRAGPAPRATQSITGRSANQLLGNVVAAAGDVDGDGDGEIVVGSYHSVGERSTDVGSVEVFSWPDLSTSVTLSRPSNAFGFSIAGAGDYDGDGLSDVAIGSPFLTPEAMSFTGEVRLFLGARAGLSASSTIALRSPSGPRTRFGHAVSFVHRNDSPTFDVAVAAPGAPSDAPALDGATFVLRAPAARAAPSVIETIATPVTRARFAVSLSAGHSSHAGQ